MPFAMAMWEKDLAQRFWKFCAGKKSAKPARRRMSSSRQRPSSTVEKEPVSEFWTSPSAQIETGLTSSFSKLTPVETKSGRDETGRSLHSPFGTSESRDSRTEKEIQLAMGKRREVCNMDIRGLTNLSLSHRKAKQQLVRSLSTDSPRLTQDLIRLALALWRVMPILVR